MAEVGLLPFARLAREVATAVLPHYRTRFSKHPFTQPQLLAVLCLMRYEDWTYREAEVRWREPRERRRALRLRSVPDYTTLYRFLRRLEEQTLQRALGEVVRRLPGVGRAAVPAGRDGSGAGSGQHVLCAAHAPSHGAAAALAARVEVAGGGRCRSATAAGPDGSRRSWERLCPCARRAWVETFFSTVKRKLSARAPGRSWFTPWRQAGLLGLAYNLSRL